MSTAPARVPPTARTVPGPSRGRSRELRRLLGHALLAFAYAATGRLGLLLAAPPGYATAVFPPAGIAAAAMLVGGPASLPWIFAGSLVLNLWVGYADAVTPSTALLAAALIAAASTAQAALTGWVLRRAVGYPAALDNGKDLARFLLAAPLCCLTSATLSVSGLWALGIVAGGAFATSWLSWWVGDTLGVVVAVPLLLVFIGEPRALWRGRLHSVAVPTLLFFALFVAMFVRISAWEDDERMLQFRLVSQHALDRVRTRLEGIQVFLEQLERSFSRAPPVSRSEFHGLVMRMLTRYPSVQAIEWAPRIALGDRPAFETAQRRDIPRFEIRQVGPRGRAQPAAVRPEFYPVTYVEPLAGNEEAVGLDLASNPERAAAVAGALATGSLTATQPIRLVQEPAQQVGLLLLQAVGGGGSGPGLVLVVLRLGSFLDGVLAGTETTLRLRLVDAVRQQALYDTFAGPADRALYRQEFEFGQRRFLIETEPTAAYLASRRGWQSWVLLAAGLLGTGLVEALLLLGTGYAHRIRAQVEERTGELAAANRRLRIEIEERRHAEAALRQAQRMEAIGRLTGGIAHDFNNLLTVVSANAELLNDRALGEPTNRRAAAILRATGRGERLTRQLLAFSRQQNLRPETVDLRQRTGEIADMLARTMRGDIEMTFDFPETLWPVRIDPAEFDLAVLNIAANARDAMPEGGEFRVSARNLSLRAGPPDDVTVHDEGLVGDFVALTFADTGCGMSAEVAAHAFDPYFTTKEIGAGSGLGLSQVYGFAKQSGGTATIESRPAAGTSITLLLPKIAASGEPAGSPQ